MISLLKKFLYKNTPSECSEINIDILSKIDTGDILLVRGIDWISYGLEFLGKSKYSHIGIIVKNPKFLNPSLEDGLYVLESTLSDIPEAESGKKVFGVQLHHLDNILKNQRNTFYIRHVHTKRDEDFYEKFTQIHTDVHGKPYDLNLFDWYAAWSNLGHDYPQDTIDKRYKETSQFWCSALASYVLAKLGIIQPDIPWSIISPREFSSNEGKQIVFKVDVEPEIMIV